METVDVNNYYPDELREKIDYYENQIKLCRKILTDWETKCSHEFGEPVYSPIHYEVNDFYGLHSDGRISIKGTGRFQTTDQWQRACNLCGKTELTAKYTTTTTKVPDFSREK